MQRQTHAHVHSQMKPPSPSSHGGSTMRSGLEQRDRSLTVMIPRAKYRPTPQQAPSILTMSTFGPEQKSMSYMDSRQTPTKVNKLSHLYFIFKITIFNHNLCLYRVQDVVAENLVIQLNNL